MRPATAFRALRSWYRAPWFQPLLVVAVLLQVYSGSGHRDELLLHAFGTLQTMASAYLAAFLASHLTAVFK
jgi:hypothetical protein